MRELTLYVTIKVKVQVDPSKSDECFDLTDNNDVAQAVGNQCDYSVILDAPEDGLKVIDTEMVDCTPNVPAGI